MVDASNESLSVTREWEADEGARGKRLNSKPAVKVGGGHVASSDLSTESPERSSSPDGTGAAGASSWRRG